MSNKFKAFNGFIFGGSASIGVLNSGFELNKVLEMTDDMVDNNAYHFHKNFDNIPIIPPKDWENEIYLKELKEKDYDLSVFNCPCSSLSQINRNASVDGKNNVHFYRVYRIIKETQPKTFVIENAPTLVKLGFPLILDMIKELGDIYSFTIIRDFAGHHNVGMKRLRTLVVGWRKNYFNNKIPLLHTNKQPQATIKDIIGDLYDAPLGSIPNHELISHRGWQEFEHLFSNVKINSSILTTVMDDWDSLKDTIPNSYKNQITKALEKKSQNKNIWDKSPWRSDENTPAPSLTSVTELIHPIHDRQWTIREYARLMGYPDNFVFYPYESKTEIIQSIAQGVPAKFIEYIATEVKETLKGNREFIDNSEESILSFQHHTKEKYKPFTIEELNQLSELEVDNTFYKLNK